MTDERESHPHLPNGRDSGKTVDLYRSRALTLALDDQRLQQEEAESTIDLRDLLRLISKRKWTILSIFLVFLVFAVIMTFLATPVYRASTTLQVDRAQSRIVDLKETGPIENSTDSFDDFIQTQIEVIRSRSLAERVIEDLSLNKKTAVRSEAGALPSSSESSEAGVGAFFQRLIARFNLNRSAVITSVGNRQNVEMINAIQGSMNVELVRKSRLVRVSFDSIDPYFAEKAANAIAQSFIAMNLERRFEASAFAKKFLEDKLLQTKAKLEDSERDLVEFSRDQGIINIDDKQSIFGQTLQEFNSAYTKAEQERIRAEVNYLQIEKDPYSLPHVQENKNLQTYKQNKARLEAEYQDNLKIFKPAYPRMLQYKAQIAEVESQIKQELDALKGAAYMAYQGSLRQESLLGEKLNLAKRELLDLQGRSIRYGILKREVDTNRQLYDGLLQRFKEIGVAGGVGVNNIAVVDKAELPLVPFSPNLRASILTGMVIGLIAGLMVAWLLDYLDDSLKYPEEVERTTGAAVLGVIPRLKGSDSKRGHNIALDAFANPNSPFAESYRSVRTGLQFSTHHGAPRRLVVTSSNKDEGKSTTAASLAINFAQMGKPVLLIDADLRHPCIHKLLAVQNDVGLSNFLSSEIGYKDVTLETIVPNLYVMTAGPLPPNPVELLSGVRFLDLLSEAGELFAHIIVDAPPVLGISDAIVLGNQIDNTIFVVEAGRTKKTHVKSALKRLRQAGVFPLGIILNKFNSAGDLYGYGGHQYYQAGHPALGADGQAAN